MRVKKIIMMILFVMAYLLIPAFNKVTSKEINYAYLSSYVAANLYSEDSFVSTNNKLLVKDYLLKENYLYIFPNLTINTLCSFVTLYILLSIEKFRFV